MKRFMITENSVMKIQNHVVNHKSQPIKSNPVNINFLLGDADSLQILVFFIFFDTTFTEAHCIMIKTMSSNKT